MKIGMKKGRPPIKVKRPLAYTLLNFIYKASLPLLCHILLVSQCYLSIWKWLYGDLRLDGVHCLEIINDPTYEADPEAKAGEANQRAVALSDLLWADGHRICAIGGSDSHNTLEERYPGATEPSVPGDPATFVYMEDLSAEHLLEGVRSCNCYVTRHCRIETGLLFGDSFRRIKRNCPIGSALGVRRKSRRFFIFTMENAWTAG